MAQRAFRPPVAGSWRGRAWVEPVLAVPDFWWSGFGDPPHFGRAGGGPGGVAAVPVKSSVTTDTACTYKTTSSWLRGLQLEHGSCRCHGIIVDQTWRLGQLKRRLAESPTTQADHNPSATHPLNSIQRSFGPMNLTKLICILGVP